MRLYGDKVKLETFLIHSFIQLRRIKTIYFVRICEHFAKHFTKKKKKHKLCLSAQRQFNLQFYKRKSLPLLKQKYLLKQKDQFLVIRLVLRERNFLNLYSSRSTSSNMYKLHYMYFYYVFLHIRFRIITKTEIERERASKR